MRNLLFVMFFLLPLIVFGQKKLTPEQKNSLVYKEEVQKKNLNTTQKRKCIYCKGVGKKKDDVTVICKNCKDWNTEYRKQVPCHACRNSREITRVELVDCWSCQDGVADRTPWDCIENYNIENNAYSLFDRDEYRFEKVDRRRDGKPTIFMYYKDGRAVWAFYSDEKPIMYGKWECKGDEGYVIKWSDGITSNFVKKKK
jgi:hypothetical protein